MHLIAEYWAQLWPNVFALSIWTVAMFLWHHYKLKQHITSEHEKWARHIVGAVNGQQEKESLPSEKEVS